MKNSEFIAGAVNTLNQDTQEIAERLSYPNMVHLLHASLGTVTESAEIADIVKKSAYYGKILDRVHLKEEVGDLLYYVAILLWNEGWTFEEVMQMNNAKLAARYPEKFTASAAVNRDYKVERSVLESGCCGGKSTCDERNEK